MAMTGFFYTFKRPRTSPMMGMLKYDPIGMAKSLPASLRKTPGSNMANSSLLLVRQKVLFLETKKRSK